jgi:hypothetical protein
MVIGVLLIVVGGFIALTYQHDQSEQNRKLAEQACHLVGKDRRTVYGILITLAFTDSVPEATRRVLARQASDVFRTLDCTEIDLDINNIPQVRLP